MARALWWKEWRNLRALRWTGAGLGLLLLLIVLPEGRMLPGVHDESLRTRLFELAPLMLGLGLWPLIALLTTTRVFSGDRALGTEPFLLERPVPRRTVWWVRLAAAAASTLWVIAVSLLFWASLAAAMIGTDAEGWREAFSLLAKTGPATAAGAMLAGMVSAALIASPLAALLLGLVFMAVPVWLAMNLGAVSSLARVGKVMVGLLAPLPLIFSYPVASWFGLNRGEPAGRGRWKRVGITLGVGLALSAAFFLVAVPSVLRWNATRYLSVMTVTPSTSGKTAALFHSGGGWIVETPSGRRLRFLPPPVDAMDWSPDAKILAVGTAAAPMGGFRESLRLEFFNGSGARAGRPVVPCGEDGWFRDLTWAGSSVLTVCMWARDEFALAIARPDGTLLTGERESYSDWATRPVLTETTSSGKVYLVVSDDNATGEEKPPGRQIVGEQVFDYSLREVNMANGSVAEKPLLRDRGVQPRWAARRLSPSGRYWIRDDGATTRGAVDRRRTVVDLQTGRKLPWQVPAWVAEGEEWGDGGTVWLAGDRLAWAERRGKREWILRGAEPDGAPRDLRSFAGETVILKPSPDRRRLLVLVDAPELGREAERDADETRLRGNRKIVESGILEAESWRWIPIPPFPVIPFTGWEYRTEWAGPHTLARIGPDSLTFEPLPDMGSDVANVSLSKS